MAKRIGIALLSFAHSHQRAWARVFFERPDARIAAVWDDDPERGKAAAAAVNAPFIADLDAVLARDDVDAVTICAENVKHAELAVRAARAGKHIMMQKPMATSVEEADRIVAAVEEAGVTYMQAYNLRFDPLHTTVWELVRSGAIGRVNVVRRRHSHHFGLTVEDSERVLGWMTDPAQAGGGALMDEGAHALLWYIWMFGPPTHVTAVMSRAMPHLRVEDNALLTLEFAEGVVGTLQTSWTEIAGGPTIEIYGDKGVIVATGTDISSTRFMQPGAPLLSVFRAETGQWEHPPVELVTARAVPPPNAFVDCLVEGRPSPVPVRVARAAVATAVAAYESARTGRRVAIDHG